ncbi:AraC family transcriptional regulator [Pelagicoccus mobilis]|uniref:Helix-turn-helix domain-containing protein n=1 Tax=Pelagicoccus mobilis TaxID=415221 RepID=A0A934VRM0_9BACT|nr:AraC family transcriptional regulator [Pelagicoccus mobilis]MBK1877624.1 helix-turn-helix domain-containing protein [Pelagicoccus mobilis]
MVKASATTAIEAQREIITACETQLFSFKADTDMWSTWHYHPEIDILLILKNTGHHITGDCIGEIMPGTLILNGANVPHAFQPSEAPDGDPENPAMLVIQFSEESLGSEFLSKPEMEQIRAFLESTRRSIEFSGKARERVEEMMKLMPQQNATQRLAQFLLILDTLASAPEDERRPLVSAFYSPSLNERNVKRIDLVKDWIIENLGSEIRLEAVAKHIGFSPKSFSRFFKKNTGKSFIQYVNELRVGEACRLLMQSDSSVAEICYASGFQNLSNFNRQFKERKGVSPKEFRRQCRERLPV